jgi:serine/threonine protein kinase
MTHAYLFEKALCEKCAHLSKVVRAIGSGTIVLNESRPETKVEYLIFELADEDIRSRLDASQTLDLVFLMRTLHDVATGLAQLHNAQIAHQDLKPSNVLVFAADSTSRICDLGRGWDMNSPGPHDSLPIAGDGHYAPIEALFGFTSDDHRIRRFGCDMYHLGSLIVFLFGRTHINALLVDSLGKDHRPAFWGGGYREVLPFVQAAFENCLNEFSATVPDVLRQDLRQAVCELCNPDPERRGHPRNRHNRQFSFERYISLFDTLAKRAQCEFFRRIGCQVNA